MQDIPTQHHAEILAQSVQIQYKPLPDLNA